MPLNITTGKQTKPRRILLYGVPGVGKSTWASKAPSPVFLPAEEGTDDIDVARLSRPKSYGDVLASLADVYKEEHSFLSLVIDTADWLERLLWEHVCIEQKKTTISDIGYGKGFDLALGLLANVTKGLDAIREKRGMHIILLAHAKAEKFEDPEHPAYDRYSPKLHKTATAYLVEWATEVLFANYKTFTHEKDAGFNRTVAKAVGTGERFVRTTAKPAAIAKNRLNLPDELEMSWEDFAKYLS